MRGVTLIRQLLLLLLIIAASGCTTFTPQYRIPPRQSTLPEAQAQLQTAIDDLQSGIRERQVINGVTGVGALLGAAGAALSPVFNGSRDLTVGLAAFGAANYAVNSIYANRTVTGVLYNGVDALMCVSSTAGGAMDSSTRVHKLATALTTAKQAMAARLDELDCTPAVVADATENHRPACKAQEIPSTQRGRVKDAAAQADAALQAANARFASETSVAGQVSDAVRRILNEVNKQMFASLPDVAAIMRLGTGISAAAIAAPTAPPAPPPPGTQSPSERPAPGLAPPPPPLPDDKELNLRIDAVTAAIASLKEGVAQPVPAIQGDSCKLADQPTTAPVTTDAPASIDLKVNNAVLTFTVTGGNGAYSTHWVGEEPSDVLAAMQANALKIVVKLKPGTDPKTFPGKSYKLDVYDSSATAPKHLATPIIVNTVSGT
jgi:hypothetical protein